MLEDVFFRTECERGGELTLGCVRMNSPISVSRVYPFTPLPVVNTRVEHEPYVQYPAATISEPGRSTSESWPFESSLYKSESCKSGAVLARLHAIVASCPSNTCKEVTGKSMLGVRVANRSERVLSPPMALTVKPAVSSCTSRSKLDIHLPSERLTTL